MTNILITIISVIAIMYTSLKSNDIIDSGEISYKEHIKVNAFSVLAFIVNFVVLKYLTNIDLSYIMILSTILMITVVSFYEDKKTGKVSRNFLRVGYLYTNIIVALINKGLTTNHILFFLLFSAVLLFVNDIGPSDARMFMLVSPVYVLFMKQPAIGLLIMLAVSAIYLKAVQIIRKDKKPVPMAPAIMTSSYVILTLSALSILF